MRRLSRVAALVVVALACLAVAAQAAPELSIVTDRSIPVYATGETATFQIALTDAGQPVNGALVTCELSTDSFSTTQKTQLTLAGGKGQVTATRQEPCVLWARVTYVPEGGKKLQKLAGAAFSPDRIEPSMAPPDDFKQFWTDQIARLNQTPANPQLKRTESRYKDVELYDVTLDGVEGTKIYGYLVKPVGKGPFPGMVVLQWAGVYSLDPIWIIGYARSGFMVLDINSHAIPNGKPKEFYRDLSRGALSGYPYQGRDSRETSYFLRMYLSCVRATDYLTSRPDWDGKHLIAQGGSQGGGQAIVTAALCPQVTAVEAIMPAMCDLTARAVGRAPGWPMMVGVQNGKLNPEQAQAARYFDADNFARMVDVPALVAVGFADLTCPASSVYSAYNQLRGPKQIVIGPLAGHMGKVPGFGERAQAFIDRQGGL